VDLGRKRKVCMCSWESFTVVTPSGGQQKLEVHSLIDTELSPVLRHFSMEAGDSGSGGKCGFIWVL
jgi:hypothetical protein